MQFEWLGLQEYSAIFEKQKQSVAWAHEQEQIWGVEHPSVITLGRRAHSQAEIEAATQYSSNVDIPVVETDRGGLATLHNPGQLVIYPLISLKRRGWGPREYVCQLLTITKICLQDLGISVHVDSAQSGLFVGDQKICFIGLRLSEGRSYHGLSLNVCNDLTEFSRIRSCGLRNRPMTSLAEQGFTALNPHAVFKRWEYIAQNSALAKGSTQIVRCPLNR